MTTSLLLSHERRTGTIVLGRRVQHANACAELNRALHWLLNICYCAKSVVRERRCSRCVPMLHKCMQV